MTKKVHVTEHAVLRFIERVHGIDVEAIREKIRDRAQVAYEMGAVGVDLDGVRLVMVDAAVTSAIPTGRAEKRGPVHFSKKYGRKAS